MLGTILQIIFTTFLPIFLSFSLLKENEGISDLGQHEHTNKIKFYIQENNEVGSQNFSL